MNSLLIRERPIPFHNISNFKTLQEINIFFFIFTTIFTRINHVILLSFPVYINFNSASFFRLFKWWIIINPFSVLLLATWNIIKYNHTNNNKTYSAKTKRWIKTTLKVYVQYRHYGHRLCHYFIFFFKCEILTYACCNVWLMLRYCSLTDVLVVSWSSAEHFWKMHSFLS